MQCIILEFGKKLIYMAWAIEITVALVGFSIAASFVLIGREEAQIKINEMEHVV